MKTGAADGAWEGEQQYSSWMNDFRPSAILVVVLLVNAYIVFFVASLGNVPIQNAWQFPRRPRSGKSS